MEIFYNFRLPAFFIGNIKFKNDNHNFIFEFLKNILFTCKGQYFY